MLTEVSALEIDDLHNVPDYGLALAVLHTRKG